ncbi:hypothetical protein [Saccharothrix sp. HUAS TT1]|uniref:hypothetical protein n=1 Tax=unclassified Saccharothrix TaxID=2593673 RepID=UPI00345B86E0
MNSTLRAAVIGTAAAAAVACGTTPAGTTQPATTTASVVWLADDVLTGEGVTSLTCESSTDQDYERVVLVPVGETTPAEGEPCPAGWVELRGPHRQTLDEKKAESGRPARPATTTTTKPAAGATTTTTTRAGRPTTSTPPASRSARPTT